MCHKEADENKTILHGLKWVATFHVANIKLMGNDVQQQNVLSLTVKDEGEAKQ